MSYDELRTHLWAIVQTEGIIITNQNIDWLLERVYKEKEQEDEQR